MILLSSKGSSSCQLWASRPPPLLSKEGGSVRVPCRVCIILKFITLTQLLMILRIHTKCSDTNCNDSAFSKPKSVDFFWFLKLLTMTLHELVIRFPSLSWHHTNIAFVNQYSHTTENQYICPQYCVFIFIHLRYFILTYSRVCILVLVSLSTRVYTRVSNINFTQLVLSFIRSSRDFTTQHPHKKEYHIIYL